jgi:predicted membrane protein
MSESPAPEPTLGQKALATLACAAALAVYIGLCILFGIYVLGPFQEWIARREGIVYVISLMVFGLTILTMFGIGAGIAETTWGTFAPTPKRSETARTHGRHARWHTGKDAEDAQQIDAGRCPKCEFSYKWDGARCGHCGYELPGPAGSEA